MPEGVIKWFSPDKGFGFLAPEDGSKDLFVALDSLADQSAKLDKGTRVKFTPGEGNKGPIAKDVTVIAAGAKKEGIRQSDFMPPQLD